MLLQHFGIVCRVTMVDPSTPLSSVLYSTPATNHHQKISPERKSQRACIFTSITMHKYDEKILLVKYRKNTEKNLPKHQTNFLHEKTMTPQHEKESFGLEWRQNLFVFYSLFEKMLSKFPIKNNQTLHVIKSKNPKKVEIESCTRIWTLVYDFSESYHHKMRVRNSTFFFHFALRTKGIFFRKVLISLHPSFSLIWRHVRCTIQHFFCIECSIYSSLWGWEMRLKNNSLWMKL